MATNPIAANRRDPPVFAINPIDYNLTPYDPAAYAQTIGQADSIPATNGLQLKGAPNTEAAFYGPSAMDMNSNQFSGYSNKYVSPVQSRYSSNNDQPPSPSDYYQSDNFSGPKLPGVTENDQAPPPDTIAPAATSTGTDWESVGKTVKPYADTFIQNMEARSNLEMDQFSQDKAKWEQSGAYWLNPNYDTKPDLDKMLAEKPDAMDSLHRSKWINTGDRKKDNVIGGIFNPIGGVATAIAGGESTERGKQFGYAVQAGNEGAAKGFASGGWVGAIGGGVIGVINGFMKWGDAKAENERNEKAARDAALIALKEWEKNQAKKRMALMQQQSDLSRAKKDTETQGKLTQVNSARQKFYDMMIGSAKNQQAQSNKRLAIYAKQAGK